MEIDMYQHFEMKNMFSLSSHWPIPYTYQSGKLEYIFDIFVC